MDAPEKNTLVSLAIYVIFVVGAAIIDKERKDKYTKNWKYFK